MRSILLKTPAFFTAFAATEKLTVVDDYIGRIQHALSDLREQNLTDSPKYSLLQKYLEEKTIEKQNLLNPPQSTQQIPQPPAHSVTNTASISGDSQLRASTEILELENTQNNAPVLEVTQNDVKTLTSQNEKAARTEISDTVHKQTGDEKVAKQLVEMCGGFKSLNLCNICCS